MHRGRTAESKVDTSVSSRKVSKTKSMERRNINRCRYTGAAGAAKSSPEVMRRHGRSGESIACADVIENDWGTV